MISGRAFICVILTVWGLICAQKPAEIKCEQVRSRYTCKSPDEKLWHDRKHQWYQKDRYGSFIGAIPSVTGQRTNFIFEFYKFDQRTRIIYNNTEYAMNSLNYQEYAIKNTKTYSEKQTAVNFHCSNIANTQIGWIDPTGYRITTHAKIDYSQRFSKADNGSMFCCLNYMTYLEKFTQVVERTVEHFTLLIYEEAVNHDNGNATASSTTLPTHSVETMQTSRVEHRKNENTPKSPAQEHTPTEGLHTTTTTHTTEPYDVGRQETSPLAKPSDKTNYYIAMASAAVVILLVSLIYVIVKKCTRKASDPEETLQMETYASTNMVYAELDIRPGTSPVAPPIDDTTYAEIIGVLKPQNDYVKK